MHPFQSLPFTDPIVTYFTSLGYKVDWDFNRAHSEEWYEILGEDGLLICQIDTGVPLADIVEDLTVMSTGKEQGTSKSDYKISTGERENPAFDELCQRVAKKGMPT